MMLCVGFVPSFFDGKSLSYAEEGYNFTNLIVFFKFAGEDEFINDDCGGDTVKGITENSYSLGEYNVKDYYSCVSNGKVNMQSVYLFSEEGGSLTLENSRGYYCKKDDVNSEGYDSYESGSRMSDLRYDWSARINERLQNGGEITNISGDKIYDLSQLDKNGDGQIDSLTIIYKYSTEYTISWSDCLWNYQSYSNLVEIDCNGNKITSNAYVQLTANYSYLYSDANGKNIASLKTMIHEMGHIFGLKDLYKTESQSPVWYMSAMAKAISPIPQYISAKEREALGWLDEGNISIIQKAGEYKISLTTSGLAEGVVCYKCFLPSKNKYLYLEYRKFSGDENKYDTQSKNIFNQSGDKIKGLSFESGLVCYLLKDGVRFPNNLTSSSYDWDYEVLGGQYSTKSDSALMVGEQLSVSTGLNISVLSIEDNILTFSVLGDDIKAEEHTHDLERVFKVDATCKGAGNIEYYKCSCGKYFLEDGREIEYSQTIIPKLEHDKEEHAYKDSSCKDEGNIQYFECKNCKKLFLPNGEEVEEKDVIISLKNHVETTIPAQSPTCTSTGLTEGKKCKNCGKILVAQEEVEKTPHRWSEWIIDVEATKHANGTKHRECLDCHKILETQEIIYQMQKSSNNLLIILIASGTTFVIIMAIGIVVRKRRRRKYWDE